ncbi:MAG: HpcH/HpaI aldolase/citrate lyase family protein [Polyangiaceae bacterium]
MTSPQQTSPHSPSGSEAAQTALAAPDASITGAALDRNRAILAKLQARDVDLRPRFLLQMAHLTCPATVWKYVESAATRSAANLVMLDLEDSIPRGNDAKLAEGRANVVRAFNTLDWGASKLRFFRPRGLALDPRHDDISVVVAAAGKNIDGLIFPKTETPDEVRSIDATLSALERKHGIEEGKISIQLLIESVSAEEQVFEIARASKRLSALIFGAYDYWGSLRMVGVPYRTDHPLVDHARARIVKAAASVDIPAIAEMTLNYPTKEKSDAEKKVALDECRRDAELARSFGFRGKWTGIPAQTEIAIDVFSMAPAVIDQAIAHAKAFLDAERRGLGATMIDGKMADRATDRINRVALKTAFALGKIDAATAAELGLS